MNRIIHDKTIKINSLIDFLLRFALMACALFFKFGLLPNKDSIFDVCLYLVMIWRAPMRSPYNPKFFARDWATNISKPSSAKCLITNALFSRSPVGCKALGKQNDERSKPFLFYHFPLSFSNPRRWVYSCQVVCKS